MYYCLFSARVLHAFLCLKVCSWCIHGERCTTPHPPTPPPSCSPLCSIFCCIPIFLSNTQGIWWYTYKNIHTWIYMNIHDIHTRIYMIYMIYIQEYVVIYKNIPIFLFIHLLRHLVLPYVAFSVVFPYSCQICRVCGDTHVSFLILGVCFLSYFLC